MPHIIEQASSGRATCRGCGSRIAKDTTRFGERLPNPYADEAAEMTHLFHPSCAALRRPEAVLETLGHPPDADPTPDHTSLLNDLSIWREAAEQGVAHHRLPRISTAGLAPTGRATCRACKEAIAKDTWRIALVYYEDGRFTPSGFIHVGCAEEYFGTSEVLDRIRHFSPDLTTEQLEAVAAALRRPAS